MLTGCSLTDAVKGASGGAMTGVDTLKLTKSGVELEEYSKEAGASAEEIETFLKNEIGSVPGVKLEKCVEKDGKMVPKIKISENVEKITNPGFKMPWRLFERGTGKAIADIITLRDEIIDDTKPYELFDPDHTWKKKIITDYVAKPLQIPIFVKGECVYESPDLHQIQAYCKEQINTLWEEVLRFENPHHYYVDLSKELWNLKKALLEEYCEDCAEKMQH